jgi:hypothetical protein
VNIISDIRLEVAMLSPVEVLQEAEMPMDRLFLIQLLLGYIVWLLCFGTYGLPRLRAMDRVQAHRAIATLHSFRFFGLVFLVSGVVGPDLPAGFAPAAAYGDFATGLLAVLALLSIRIRPLFWAFVVAFNLVGTADLLLDYWHAVGVALPEHAGALGATYVIPILFVPLLMITHAYALHELVRFRPSAAGDFADRTATI